MLMKIFEVFCQKAAEYFADQGLNNGKNIKDFEHNLETLQKSWKFLSAKASDVEEEIKNAELSGRKKRKREVEEWLRQVNSFKNEVVELGSQVESEGFVMRLMDGGKVVKLNEEVEKLVEQSRDFGELLIDVCGTRGEPLLTNGMVGFAFDENLGRILELLMSRAVPSIGVYGMGGVGKTTLAKHIHNRLLQQSQGDVFWITVSQEFTIRSLQNKIARFLGVKLEDEDEEDIRAATLNRVLSQKKDSVLILDDVWENIDLLKVGCPVSMECCRLIITTRSLEVCRRIRCQKVIALEKLHEDEAWMLFKEKIETELDPQVEEIAKAMSKLCDGLPLGIITVAGSMRGETLIYTWRHAKVKLEEYVKGQYGMDEEDKVFKVLKYSFDRLSRHHPSHEFNLFQLCFLYCSLYPEDYKIPREDLVRKFISYGLVDQRRSRREQIDQGHSILHKLTSVCLLESCADDYVDDPPDDDDDDDVIIECVKMHDLVRGMALKIGKGKYMVRAGNWSLKEIPNEEEWTKDLEKVSLMRCGIKRIEDGISPDCSNLSTLILSWNPYIKFISHSFFSKMVGLRTLDLCRTNIRMLPDSISDMESLEALLLEDCDKLEIVPYLGKLKALRELNISKTNITEVPQGLEELLNLKFLSINAPRLNMLPTGLLLKLGQLKHVDFPSQIQVPIEEIKNLKQLGGLCGRLSNVRDFNSFVGSLHWVHNNSCYIIGVGPSYARGISGSRDCRYCYNNELTLSKCSLEDENVLGQSIVYLTVIKCKGLSLCFVDNFSQSSNPTSLERLRIESCGGLECLLSNDEGSTPFQFSTLEHIRLVGLEDLKGVVIQREEIGAAAPAHAIFSSLKRLKISRCNNMRKVGLPVSRFPNLELIDIRECVEMEEIFKDDGRGSVTILNKLKELRLAYLPRLMKVGLAVSRVPNIERIDISSCEEIEEIFKDDGRGSVTILNKLKELRLAYLPRLMKVGLAVSRVPNIERIDISSCEEIEEIFEEDEERAASIITTLSKLRELKLKELPRLRKMGLQASAFPNLEVIDIKSCGKIEEIFKDEGRDSIITLPKLEVLQLEDLPSVKSVNKATIFSNSIRYIVIWKCPLMKRLPLHMDVPLPPHLEEIIVEREWWESLE